MATFEECLDGLDGFAGFLLKHFNDAVEYLRIHPMETNEISGEVDYQYVVTLRRELDDEENQIFPIQYEGVPVASHIAHPDFLKRAEME